MISKKDQTHKVKRISTKKMSAVELQLYKDFINDISDNVCQNPNCNNLISEHHHSMRGAYKTDTSLTGICHSCHNTLHFSTDTHEREALTVLFKGIGRDNWNRYVKV